MKSRPIAAAVAGVLLVGAIAVVVMDRRASNRLSEGAGEQDRVTPSSPGVARAAAKEPGNLRIERDPAVVFQRAFWRRLGSDVRVLNAERRETLGDQRAVQTWAWFVALQATPEFRRWLFEQNPFELTRRAAGELEVPGAPTWFPSADVRATLVGYTNHEHRFCVFLDEKSGRIFAADHGGGFAVARQADHTC